MKKKKLVSNCCKAEVRLSEIVPDFFGDERPTIGTVYYICEECEEACDAIEVKTRKKK